MNFFLKSDDKIATRFKRTLMNYIKVERDLPVNLQEMLLLYHSSKSGTPIHPVPSLSFWDNHFLEISVSFPYALSLLSYPLLFCVSKQNLQLFMSEFYINGIVLFVSLCSYVHSLYRPLLLHWLGHKWNIPVSFGGKLLITWLPVCNLPPTLSGCHHETSSSPFPFLKEITPGPAGGLGTPAPTLLLGSPLTDWWPMAKSIIPGFAHVFECSRIFFRFAEL